MNGMDGMGWGMSLISLLVLILVVLGILALVKYLSGRK
jgi:Tfp pilus assembly protein PilE